MGARPGRRIQDHGQVDVGHKSQGKSKNSQKAKASAPARKVVSPPAPRPEAPGPAAPQAPVAPPAAPPPAAAPVPAPRPAAPAPRRSIRTACYIDFENLFYNVAKDGRSFNVARAARSLNRLSREACGEGFAHTAVYANWDSISAHARFAQNDWAQVGWRTVAVPTREDQVSGRVVKNLVDFVMSLDLLEDARDRDFDHFFVVSGDADFCEVVERLKRLRRKVTVVCLRRSLSYRLSEAADQVFAWDPDEISGKDTFPLQPAGRPPRTSPGLRRDPDATELDLLRTAVRLAERETGAGVVDWETVRDEYYLPLARCGPEEADTLVRDLAGAGFVILEQRRVRDGSLRHYLRIPA